MQNKDYYTTFIRLRPEEDENEDGFPKPRFSVPELLQHLISRTETLTGEDLFALSDLSRQDAAVLRQEWPLIPTKQREALVESLVELAKEDIDWHLGRFLRVAIDDSDATIRRIAIDGLWEEKENDLLGPLTQLLYHDPNEQVRAAAAGALGAYVLAGELDELDAALAMRAEEALLAVLQNDEEPTSVQARALESIAYSGENGVRQLIEDNYYSPEEELRISALVAMGRSADSRWRGLVRAELENPSARMRAEAARACGELELKKAEAHLLALLEDEAQEVRLAAIFALGRIGGKKPREALRALTQDDETVEAEAADAALEDMLFFGNDEGNSLIDEEEADDGDDGDFGPWDNEDVDDDELGVYDK